MLTDTTVVPPLEHCAECEGIVWTAGIVAKRRDSDTANLLCFGCAMHPSVLKSKRMEAKRISYNLDASYLGSFIDEMKR